MLKVAICDDEPYFRERMKETVLKYMLAKEHDYQIKCFESGDAYLKESTKESNYHIVFLDINMKGLNGIETAEAIRLLTPDTYIVFVTAYITYSPKGYMVNAIRYILKEDNNLENAVAECLDTIIDIMNYREIKCTFESQNRKLVLKVDRILYVESRLHKVIFFVMEESLVKYYIYDKLDTVSDMLKQFGFQRTHQSFLVNMKYVKNIERYKAILLNGMEISISKRYYKEIEEQYIKLRGDI